MKARQQLKLLETLEYIQSPIADVPIMVHRLWFSILERIPVPAESGYTTTIRDILNLLSVCERHLIAEEVDGGLSYDLRNLTWYNYRFSDRYGVWRHFPALLELVGQPGKNGNGLATDNLRFVHPSLKQLLQSDSMRNGPLSHFAIDALEAQQGVAERCVSHLLRHSTADSYRSKYGWTAYAGAYWHTHVRKLASHASQDLITRSISLLNPRTPSFVHWTHMTKRDRVYGTNAPADFQVQDLYPTPLYYAALLGLHECALKLLTDGADVNARGGQHGCPLAAAVVAGEECLGLKMLDAGAETGNAALKAAEFGRHQILQKLLANGANVLDRDGLERNMVHWSARNNHLLCLRILAKFSAGLEASDVYGNTPLHLASIYGNTESIQFFLSHGVHIEAEDAQSRTPLVAAATKGQHEALLLLLENGAEVNAYDSDMQTALCYAAASANPDVVTSLLSHGANPNVQARSDGSTPLHMAVTSTPYVLAEDVRKTKSTVEALLRYGADHSIKDGVGHVAEDKTSDPELKTLLRKPRSDFAPENKLIGPRDKILFRPHLTFEEDVPLQDPSIWLPGFNDLPAEEQEHIKGL